MGKENRPLADQIESERVACDDSPTAPLIARIEKSRVRKKSYLMDLRIHSPSSLGCSGIDGIDAAPALVRLAKVKGLDMIGVTDYYQSAFAERVIQAAKDHPLVVIPGVDLRCVVGTCDDVTLSCFFPEETTPEHVNQFLNALAIPMQARGREGYIVRSDFATVLSVIDQFGAVALPSRVDKTPHRFSAVPVLIEKYGFRAFDVAHPETATIFKKRWPKLKCKLFSFSSANALAQVGSRVERVKLPSNDFAGLSALVSRESIDADTTERAEGRA